MKRILAICLTCVLLLLSACVSRIQPGEGESSREGLRKSDKNMEIAIRQLPSNMQAAGEIALSLSSAGCEELIGKTSLDAEEACRFYFAVWETSENPRAEEILKNTYAEDVEELTNKMLGLSEERDYSVIAIELGEAEPPFWFYYKDDGGIGRANATDGMDVMIIGYDGNEDESSEQPYTISVSAAYPANPDEIAYIITWEFTNTDGEIHILNAVTMQANTAAAESLDGKYRVEAYGVDDSITYGGMYPAEGICLIEVATGKELWQMTPGYYVADFLWTTDSRYVSVYYEARIYGASLVIDTRDMSITDLPGMTELLELFPDEADPQENRPDPYITPREWLNDYIIRVDFEWVQQDGETFTGYYDFDMELMQIVELCRQPEAE